MNCQRIYFEVTDPVFKDQNLLAYVDLEKRSDEIIITDWGVLYDRVLTTTGGQPHLTLGRKVQPHWAFQLMEQKRREAKPEDFPTFEGYFSLNDYKNIQTDNQKVT